MGIRKERKDKRIKLLNSGHKDLVKDSKGWWRPRINKKNPKSYKKRGSGAKL